MNLDNTKTLQEDPSAIKQKQRTLIITIVSILVGIVIISLIVIIVIRRIRTNTSSSLHNQAGNVNNLIKDLADMRKTNAQMERYFEKEFKKASIV